MKKISDNTDISLQPALERILYLSALYFIDKHMAIFYQGGYFFNDKPVFLIRETILELCNEVKNDSMGLIDAMAAPDYVINSALGDANGDVYKKVYSLMIQSAQSMQPIEYLEDYLNRTKTSVKSNL